MGQRETGRVQPAPLAGREPIGQVLRRLLASSPASPARLPPGQQVRPDWLVQHYGPVPRFRPETWDFLVTA